MKDYDLDDPEKRKRLFDFANGLVASAKYADALEKISNQALADLLLRKVWAELPMNTNESDIVDEAIRRLREMK